MAELKSTIKKRKIKTNLSPYLFIAPFFIIFISFSLFPILFSFFVSLNDWDGFTTPQFVGFANYSSALGDMRLRKALGNTFLLMLMIIPIQIVLGFITANVINSKSMVFRNTFRLINFLPYLTAPVATGIIFAIMFDVYFGPVNMILKLINIDRINWMGLTWPARSLVAMITIWRFYGYTAVIFYAGLTNVNPDLTEAAEIDGTNTIQKAFYIILPILKPVTTFIILTTMIGCFQLFEVPFMIFGVAGGGIIGGPRNSVLTAIWLFYDTAFSNQLRYGYGSSIAIIFFIVIAIISFTANKIINRGGDDL